MERSNTRIVPVRRKLPGPFFLVLNFGKPGLTFFPARLSFSRRKNWAKALSRLYNASCGAHFDTSYIHARSLFFRTFSSRCRVIAVGILSFLAIASFLRASPQLYAKRAAPAC